MSVASAVTMVSIKIQLRSKKSPEDSSNVNRTDPGRVGKVSFKTSPQVTCLNSRTKSVHCHQSFDYFAVEIFGIFLKKQVVDCKGRSFNVVWCDHPLQT